MKDSNLEILIKGINSTENLWGEVFNKHPDALYAYAQLFGKDQLKETLDSKDDLEYNAFYSITWCFENEIKEREISTDIIKYYIDKIIHETRKNHMLIMLIELAIQRGEIEKSISYVSEIKEHEYHAYRKILMFYAENGDLKEFKKYLKLSKPAKSPRNVIYDAKAKFVSNYSENQGIENSIKILDDKIFGWKFCYSVIQEQAHKLSLNQIDKILEKYPQFYDQDQFIKPWFFVHHYSNQRLTEISETKFNKTLEEVIKIDKNIKRGDGRLRDYLLFDLGSSVSNTDQIKECKKNIVAPFYKRELNYHLKNLKEKTMGNTGNRCTTRYFK